MGESFTFFFYCNLVYCLNSSRLCDNFVNFGTCLTVILCSEEPDRKWVDPASSWSSRGGRSWYCLCCCWADRHLSVSVCENICLCVCLGHSWTVGSILVWRGWMLCPTST